MRCGAGAEGARAIRLFGSTRAISACAGSRAIYPVLLAALLLTLAFDGFSLRLPLVSVVKSGAGLSWQMPSPRSSRLSVLLMANIAPCSCGLCRLQSTKRGLTRAWENLCTRPIIAKVCVNNVEPGVTA